MANINVSTDKIVTTSTLSTFKTQYTNKYIGDLKKSDGAGGETLATVKEYVDAQVSTGGAGSVVSIDEVTTGLASDVLKSYVFYQGEKKDENKIGTINLAKDLVVTAGEVVVDPAGQTAGTYLQLTIANQTEPVYINVKDLVDLYTTGSVATDMVVVAVDASTNKITATLTDGTITKAKLHKDLSDEITAATTAIGVEPDAGEGVAGSGILKRLADVEAASGAVDYSGKADKVASATAGNFAALDADGNLTDSGKKADDFEVAGAAADVLGTAADAAGDLTVNGIKKYVDSILIAEDSDITGLFD